MSSTTDSSLASYEFCDIHIAVYTSSCGKSMTLTPGNSFLLGFTTIDPTDVCVFYLYPNTSQMEFNVTTTFGSNLDYNASLFLYNKLNISSVNLGNLNLGQSIDVNLVNATNNVQILLFIIKPLTGGTNRFQVNV